MSARLIADLIGLPYQDRGRGPDAYDCEGLFLKVQQRRGYTGGKAANGPTEQRARAWLHVAESDWFPLEAPRAGCAVFFPQELHVGTMYDTQRFFHTSSELGHAHIDSLDAPQWKHKTKFFYDWVPA
jgi:cell wall-associated NlpC family hydrolase